MADDRVVDEAGDELEEDVAIGPQNVEQGVVFRMAEGELVDPADCGVVGGLRRPN